MTQNKFKYIYGPVSSWRLGNSLGIDILSQKEKICNFNCVYCQIGRNQNYALERELYVPTEDIIKELKTLPDVHIDYITFSGSGEATLAINLGQAISEIKKLRKEPVAVLTNASLINRKDVREELALADLVSLKLDACSQKILEEINSPAPVINFDDIFNGIKTFRKEYSGKLALQIMFINRNKDMAKDLAELAFQIHPDEVQINTPLRESPAKALSPPSINSIKEHFKGLNIISVYDSAREQVMPIDKKSTQKRRGA